MRSPARGPVAGSWLLCSGNQSPLWMRRAERALGGPGPLGRAFAAPGRARLQRVASAARNPPALAAGSPGAAVQPAPCRTRQPERGRGAARGVGMRERGLCFPPRWKRSCCPCWCGDSTSLRSTWRSWSVMYNHQHPERKKTKSISLLYMLVVLCPDLNGGCGTIGVSSSIQVCGGLMSKLSCEDLVLDPSGWPVRCGRPPGSAAALGVAALEPWGAARDTGQKSLG
uniref:Uncharacterized protein n=1 Tax=Nothoprocta perdicaria TaxID=30464 RepID=A0A8C7EAT7_NOTPE